MKQIHSLHSDPPLLLSHSAASTSCDSRLQEQLTPRQLHVADPDDDDVPESSRYMLQRMRTHPLLTAGNKNVELDRVLCPYHQLVAANSITVAEPVAFHGETLRPAPGDDFCFRDKNDAAVCRHEIDLIRDSLNNATQRNSCDRQSVELARVSDGDYVNDCERCRTTLKSTTTASSSSALRSNLSRTLGRATDVSFTRHLHDHAPVSSTDQVTCSLSQPVAVHQH